MYMSLWKEYGTIVLVVAKALAVCCRGLPQRSALWVLSSEACHGGTEDAHLCSPSPTRILCAAQSTYLRGRHLGLKEVPLSILGGVCMYHSDTLTLWAVGSCFTTQSPVNEVTDLTLGTS